MQEEIRNNSCCNNPLNRIFRNCGCGNDTTILFFLIVFLLLFTNFGCCCNN